MTTINIPAPEGSVFGPGAAKALVGTTTKFEGRDALILEAEIVDGGSAMQLTIQTSDALTGKEETR